MSVAGDGGYTISTALAMRSLRVDGFVLEIGRACRFVAHSRVVDWDVRVLHGKVAGRRTAQPARWRDLGSVEQLDAESDELLQAW